ncbi:PAS domain-containing sensor histidine kinase [Alteraurantiacibacter buctensis]|uniref:histidine kinase n=1 Tax=Alteraurantiacibacter buctensis TaxID=1503981 RepID=A0A844YX95_9SPHN|nr:PAS domain-containing sensor histidine kinase [Alteraurantiacibacter buctensis]MXO71590.1 PAS domain-containing protein [Alteraurantiacibacter buctensis]
MDEAGWPEPGSGYTQRELVYRQLFDSMDEGFCVIEFLDGPHGPMSDYIHVLANAAYERNAGIPDVVGQRLRNMVSEQAANDWVSYYRKVLVTGEPIRFERELEETGRYLSLSSFRIEPPEARQVAVLFQDISARRKAEEDLRELNRTLEQRVDQALAERRLLADVVEQTDAFVQVVDLEGNWLAINAAAVHEFERVHGVTAAAGANMFEAVAGRPTAEQEVRSVWSRALAGEEYTDIAEFGDPGRDRRYYEMRFSNLHGQGGERIGAYLMCYDVTERLEEQKRLAQAEEALRQAQKMEAVGQLTGGLAHDFNNLLMGISGSLEMISARLAQGKTGDVERYLNAAQGATRRAAALTHRLLAFARRQTLEPTPVVVNDLLPDLMELVRRTVGPAIKVESVAAAGLWSVNVDHNQLENALLNLCINARDAMPMGGLLTIETGNKWIDSRTAQSRQLDEGQYVTICVSDTGSGIEKDLIDKVFDPFFTTKPIGEGTGLGLSMVYGFARQSDGHVRIYSEVGQGTMVCIYLPRHHGEAAVAEQPQAQAIEPVSAGTRRVLVIDDEPLIRMLVVESLEEAGFTCLEAGDGPNGLAVLEQNKDIEVLVTDVGLPGGLNGRQVADRARELYPELKVLFVTGYAENAALNHGHIGPGTRVLTKPFAVNDLVARVNGLLESD